MAGDIRLHGDSIAWLEDRDGRMHRDDLLERDQGMDIGLVWWVREGDRIDKPRRRTHVRVCACLLLSLDLCTLRARNGRPIYGGRAVEYDCPVEYMVGTVTRTHISRCS